MASSSDQLQAPSNPISSLLPVTLPPLLTYKNDLQELAQRCAIADPIYKTVNEGYQHALKFRCTVKLDGMRFTSELTFNRRKSAEQEAARIALEGFTKKIKEEGHSFVLENAIEYGISSKKRQKMNYKANKKARMAAELPPPVGEVLVNQVSNLQLITPGGRSSYEPSPKAPVKQVSTCFHCGSVMK